MKIRILLQAALVLLAAASCTREDTSHCPPPGVVFRFAYTMNEDYTCHFREEVSYVDLFIYDTAGQLCMEQRVPTADMEPAEPYGMQVRLLLPVGDYTVAAWAHVDADHHAIQGRERLDAALLATRFEMQDDERIVRRTLPHIFHGTTQVAVPMSQIADAAIDFTKNTNDIHVSVEGPGDYDVFLSASNGNYRFDNSFGSEDNPQPLVYLPVASDEPATAGASRAQPLRQTIRTQRLRLDDDSRIVIRERLSQDVVLDESLTGLIRENPDMASDEMLDRIDEYEIRLQTDITGAVLRLTVNGWEVVNQNTPIG